MCTCSTAQQDTPQELLTGFLEAVTELRDWREGEVQSRSDGRELALTAIELESLIPIAVKVAQEMRDDAIRASDDVESRKIAQRQK